MADQDDENYFSDNALDTLPQSTLQDLEYNALSSTQQHVAALRSRQYAQAKRPYKLSVPTTSWQKSVPTRPSASHVPIPDQTQEDPDPPSSDYGLDDEDVIDLDEPTMLIQPASGPPDRTLFDDDTNPHENDASYQDYHTYQDENSPQEDHDYQGQFRPQVQSITSEARVKELERRLVMAEQSARNSKIALETKAGEAVILRSKHEKDMKEFERQLAYQQKLRADESAKHRVDVEAARKERETVETNNRFLEHDLAQEVERKKRFKPAARSPTVRGNHKDFNSRNGAAATPERVFDIPYRDGFDNHEIVVVSPSKPKDKSKAGTPKAGEKRKRNFNPSPARPLDLEPVARTPSPSVVGDDTFDINPSEKVVDEPCFQTVQHILNHRSSTGCDRTLELLTRHAFPSAPQKSVAGHLVDGLTRFVAPRNNADLPLYVCNLLLDLWSRCLEENYYAPLQALIDLLEFVLALRSRSSANALIPRFVPLVIKSIDLIAVPLARPVEETPTPENTKPKLKTALTLSEEINIDQILGVAHEMSITASLSTETNRAFWQQMEFDFLLMMLNVPQQLPHIQLVLQMVSASVLPESFGVVSQQAEKQLSYETHTIDRLTNLLFEQPIAPSDEPPYEDVELSSLRTETIRTLSAISVNKRGSSALAQHRTAVGRLVRFLHIQVTALYDLPPSSYAESSAELVAGPSTVHKITTATINLTIRLLYHLLHDHADLIVIREKLDVIPGGPQKFLVCLTRLAFSEELVFEAGIDEETVDAAHEILDLVLTPEEGDAIVEAIETPRGTRASAPG